MDSGTHQLLKRWELLRSGAGLARATSVARGLWFLGLALFLLVVFGIYYKFSPVALVVASLATGWVVAERNALESRISQWPTFARYIDWQRVDADLSSKQDA